MAKTHNEIHLRALSRQFDALRSLSDGWYDGAGNAPDAVALETIETWMHASYPADLPVPAIVPTPEADLLFEWDTPGNPSIDISPTPAWETA